ncbi:DUF2326 domain-containing protein [Parabacteroides merdae]|uniref:DUF2326 domain-containing protein n=1 Tax=Parabacteroides merdae TaxID=46503 RepID=UPI0039B6C8A9
MLKEIYCDKFKKKLIEFHDGLNIILGDDIASNSIGKSTMLLAIDFAFGGDTYAKQDNIIRNVKHHTLKFKFHFNNEDFYYSRSTDSQNIVTVCDKFWNKQYEIKNDEYTNLLKAKYVSSDLLLSFRELLGTYTRIYGKQNCNENHPLHIVPNEKMSLIINRILKLFEVYNQVEDQEKTINSKDEQLKAYKTASQAEIIPTLKNKKEKNDSNEKIESIKQNIKNITTQIASQSVDLKSEQLIKLDPLRSQLVQLNLLKANIQSQIKRLEYKKNKNKNIDDTILFDLKQYFPNIELASITEINKFHQEINDILSEEINKQIEEKNIYLSEIEKQTKNLTQQISVILNEKSSINLAINRMLEDQKILDRLLDTRFFTEQKEMLSKDLKILRATLDSSKEKLLTEIQQKINSKIEFLNKDICHDTKPPIINLSPKKYTFFTIDDTGTGTNFKGLILLDLAILHLTQLPILIHDSVLFKNIAFDTMDNLINQYNTFIDKQIFIATDAINNYSEPVQEIIENKKVIVLGKNGNELFGYSWSSNK